MQVMAAFCGGSVPAFISILSDNGLYRLVRLSKDHANQPMRSSVQNKPNTTMAAEPPATMTQR